MATKTEYVVIDSTQPSLVLNASRIILPPGKSFQFQALFTGTPSITYGTKFPKYFSFDTTTYIVSCKELGDLPISSGSDSAWCYFNLTLDSGGTYRAEVEVKCDCDASEVVAYEPILHNYEKVETPYIADEFINGFYDFAMQRELSIYLSDDDNWWVYDEILTRMNAVLKPIKSYFESDFYKKLQYNLMLHYLICLKFSYTDSTGNVESNPLYSIYRIENKGFMTQSVSDNGSSASMLVNKTYTDGDLTLIDLIRTPYGQYVYSVLEQMKIYPVLL